MGPELLTKSMIFVLISAQNCRSRNGGLALPCSGGEFAAGAVLQLGPKSPYIGRRVSLAAALWRTESGIFSGGRLDAGAIGRARCRSILKFRDPIRDRPTDRVLCTHIDHAKKGAIGITQHIPLTHKHHTIFERVKNLSCQSLRLNQRVAELAQSPGRSQAHEGK